MPKIETEKEGMDVVEEKNGLPPLPTILVGVPAVVNYPVELFVFLRQPMTSFTIICSGRNTNKKSKVYLRVEVFQNTKSIFSFRYTF